MNQKIRIARHEEGISLNPLEYLKESGEADAKVLNFDTKELAIDFLHKATGLDYTEEQWGEREGMYLKEVTFPDYFIASTYEEATGESHKVYVEWEAGSDLEMLHESSNIEEMRTALANYKTEE